MLTRSGRNEVLYHDGRCGEATLTLGIDRSRSNLVSRKEGRKRFGLVVGATSGLVCAILMALVLVVYGTPYNGVWWLIMLVILFAACVGPRLLVYPLEWVLDGYRRD